MLRSEQLAADVAARIATADQQVYDAAAAFAAGRFPEYWALRAEALFTEMAQKGDEALADAAKTEGPAADSSGVAASPSGGP